MSSSLEGLWSKVKDESRPSDVIEGASYCALFGVFAGGGREWQRTGDLITEGSILQEEMKIRERYKDRSFATPKSKQMLRYYASKEAHGLRMLRVVTNSTRWCLSFGAIGAAYVGLEQASSIFRNREDVWNAVAAGATSGCLAGLCIPGTGWMKIRGAAVGCVGGGLLSFPFGYAKILSKSIEITQGQDPQKEAVGVGPESPASETTNTETAATPKAKQPGPIAKLMRMVRGGGSS